MKFSTALISTALLTGTTLAAPLTAERAARHEARRQARATKVRHGNPPFLPDTQSVIDLSNNETVHEQYSQNWAGAVLIGTGYTAVTGQFTVPTPKAPSGSSSGDYAASAWVGIDGDTWSKAILQTGVDFTVTNGEASFSAWYEWYPDYAYDFTGIDISAGDEIKVTVEATSTSAGTATVENVSSGQKVSHSFSGETSGELGELNAEWIVEDFQEGSSLVDLANFGTVTFTGAQATSGGSSVGPSGATILDIKQSGTVYTSSSVTDDTVVVAYQG
ncbi:hypothetical protein N7456_006534 [Penicillium angulare]|uniref:Aspergillopepsin-2 n=1 Tax=Penicillium angulare TaxID=116970 RepID=A0A9W9FHV7_9EURO|nr:hypothetical protein N7456_006534 [Penicillium angulare]